MKIYTLTKHSYDNDEWRDLYHDEWEDVYYISDSIDDLIITAKGTKERGCYCIAVLDEDLHKAWSQDRRNHFYIRELVQFNMQDIVCNKE